MYIDVIKSSKKFKKMSQQKISNECKKIGIKISRSYINKILNQNVIPNEEISKTLAKVLDIDAELLILEGYLQKAPDFFKNYLDNFLENYITLSLIAFKKIKVPFSLPEKDLTKKAKKFYVKKSRAKNLLEILKGSQFDIGLNNILNMEIETKLDERVTINLDNELLTNVNDDSMEPLIPKDSKVKLSIQEKYEDGDIVSININGNFKIRAISHLDTGLLLYPYNKKYKNEIVTSEDYKILGKVSSCMFDL